ncbi:MAG TPA: adenylate/guanylate cyclase domain-containing protein [Candidatus Limnocylindria bacterium]|nr:adenylate/guanylate cyclase domain-containing protein [Candidatus Limnocylindria bacterium]
MIARLLAIGADPRDPPELGRRKRLLVAFMLAIVVVGPAWSAIYVSYGEPLAAIAPILYPPLTLVNLARFARHRSIEKLAAAQSLAILVLPFLVHVALGGYGPSSAVVLWSMLSPLGALVFIGVASGFRWLIAFVGVLVLAALAQPRASNALPAWLVTGFFVANIGTILGVAFGLLASYSRQLTAERARSERLLLNVLPPSIAQRLREREQTIADQYEAATVLFADVVNSTPLTVELSPAEMVGLLNEHVSAFDALADRYGVEKIRTIGDNWMGVAGAPVARPEHAASAARLALAMLAYVESRRGRGERCLDFRIGLNSGPVIGGVIGTRKFVFDIWGDPVNTAARMESHGIPGRIQLTEATYDLIKDRFECEPRGTIEVKGKGLMRTWYLVRERPQA